LLVIEEALACKKSTEEVGDLVTNGFVYNNDVVIVIAIDKLD